MKILGSAIILTDDFNNVLILKKGKKKEVNNPWQIVGRALKGKESSEKCISNCVKEDLNTLIFDLCEVKTLEVKDGACVAIYAGKLKDFMNHGKNVIESEWISKDQFEKFEIKDVSRKILEDYFNL